MSRSWCLLALIGSLAVPGPVCRAGEDTDLRERGLKKWAALEKATENLDATYTWNESYVAGKSTIPIKYKLLVNGNSVLVWNRALLKFNDPSLGEVERVIGRTPDYTYSLERKVGNEVYRLGYIGQETEDFPKKLMRSRQARLVPVFIQGRTVTDWLKDSHFAVGSLTRVQQDGRNMIQLDATYAPSETDARKHMTALTAWFDEQAGWALRKYEAKVWYGTQTVTIDYAEPAGDAPRPLRVTERIDYPPNKKSPPATSSIDFETWNYRSVAPEEFLISQFGLPEPQTVTPPPVKRSLLWAWLIGGAVVVGGVGIMLLRWGRRGAPVE